LAALRLALLSFGWEPLEQVIREPNFGDLATAHWQESGILKDVMPLDPDIPRVLWLAEQGMYRSWVARDGDTLAGYVGFLFNTPIQFKSTPTVYEDTFTLAPAYRVGWNGYNLLASAVDAIRQLDVKVIVFSVPDRLAPLFDRLGCAVGGRLRIKVL
jgi:hypothetical protein